MNADKKRASIRASATSLVNTGENPRPMALRMDFCRATDG
jgi:hypothetical protein